MKCPGNIQCDQPFQPKCQGINFPSIQAATRVSLSSRIRNESELLLFSETRVQLLQQPSFAAKLGSGTKFCRGPDPIGVSASQDVHIENPTRKKTYLPRGSNHALKKGLTNLISFPALNRMLMPIMRVIARFTDAVLCGPISLTKSIE